MKRMTMKNNELRGRTMNNQEISNELLKVAKTLEGLISPDHWEDPVEKKKLRQEHDEQIEMDGAMEKLERKLDLVKDTAGRKAIFWLPGRSIMIRFTVIGHPHYMEYSSVGGRAGVGELPKYDDGVLTVNPGWTERIGQQPPRSFKWIYMVDEMIRFVKKSEKINDKVEDELEEVEEKTGFWDWGIKKAIIKWCIKVAKIRLSKAPKEKNVVVKSLTARTKK